MLRLISDSRDHPVRRTEFSNPVKHHNSTVDAVTSYSQQSTGNLEAIGPSSRRPGLQGHSGGCLRVTFSEQLRLFTHYTLVDHLLYGVNGGLGGSIINTDGTSEGDANRSSSYPIPARPVIRSGVWTLSGTPQSHP
jgi:hypothetical protein